MQRLTQLFRQQAGQRPDRLWVGNVTYLPVGRRTWWFLAAVADQCSRRVVAWGLAARRDSHLTIRVLAAAIRRRHPLPALIFHSDRGSEYCALALRDRLVAGGYQQSATRRGPEDNAHIESFFHSLKAEMIHGRRFATPEALRRAIAEYVRYCNFRRVHSALDSPGGSRSGSALWSLSSNPEPSGDCPTS